MIGDEENHLWKNEEEAKKMGCWDSVWFCSSDMGEETRKLNSNPGYSFPKHIKKKKKEEDRKKILSIFRYNV